MKSGGRVDEERQLQRRQGLVALGINASAGRRILRANVPAFDGLSISIEPRHQQLQWQLGSSQLHGQLFHAGEAFFNAALFQ